MYNSLLVGKPLLPIPRDQELHLMHADTGPVDVGQAKSR